MSAHSSGAGEAFIVVLVFVIAAIAITSAITTNALRDGVERAAICARGDPQSDAAKYEHCLDRYSGFLWPAEE